MSVFLSLSLSGSLGGGKVVPGKVKVWTWPQLQMGFEVLVVSTASG